MVLMPVWFVLLVAAVLLFAPGSPPWLQGVGMVLALWVVFFGLAALRRGSR